MFVLFMFLLMGNPGEPPLSTHGPGSLTPEQVYKIEIRAFGGTLPSAMGSIPHYRETLSPKIAVSRGEAVANLMDVLRLNDFKEVEPCMECRFSPLFFVDIHLMSGQIITIFTDLKRRWVTADQRWMHQEGASVRERLEALLPEISYRPSEHQQWPDDHPVFYRHNQQYIDFFVPKTARPFKLIERYLEHDYAVRIGLQPSGFFDGRLLDWMQLGDFISNADGATLPSKVKYVLRFNRPGLPPRYLVSHDLNTFLSDDEKWVQVFPEKHKSFLAQLLALAGEAMP